jgi:hypothetical protein
MCYFTFIGGWKQLSPPEMIVIKRSLDRDFYSALPLFSPGCEAAYTKFMQTCFSMFGEWGDDARLRTGFIRRRRAYPGSWDHAWERMFTHTEDQRIAEEELLEIRADYNAVLGALAREIELLAPRDRYAPEEVSPHAQ